MRLRSWLFDPKELAVAAQEARVEKRTELSIGVDEDGLAVFTWRDYRGPVACGDDSWCALRRCDLIKALALLDASDKLGKPENAPPVTSGVEGT